MNIVVYYQPENYLMAGEKDYVTDASKPIQISSRNQRVGYREN